MTTSAPSCPFTDTQACEPLDAVAIYVVAIYSNMQGTKATEHEVTQTGGVAFCNSKCEKLHEQLHEKLQESICFQV